MRFALDSPLSEGFSERNNPDYWGAAKTKELVEVLGWAQEAGLVVTQHHLVHHWPCKAGKTRHISYLDSVDLVIRGKLRIKRQIQGIQVSIEQFIDWGPGDCTHDLIKMEPYIALLKTHLPLRNAYEAWQEYAEQVSGLPVLKILTRPERLTANA
jgi:hypothetical protein